MKKAQIEATKTQTQQRWQKPLRSRNLSVCVSRLSRLSSANVLDLLNWFREVGQ